MHLQFSMAMIMNQLLPSSTAGASGNQTSSMQPSDLQSCNSMSSFITQRSTQQSASEPHPWCRLCT
jgi:hypothetical protein